ncbi:MAG: hypothetical protein Kow0029_25160 [Candidatus Rifleibacteriota bacterium]
MFCSEFFSHKVLTRVFCSVFVMLAIYAGPQAWAISPEKPVFTDIVVKEIAPPHGFLNARRYLITYFVKSENSYRQVFPTLDEKKRDYDLILARVVRQYLEDEYFNGNKGMDEHVVSDSSKGEIFDLVSKNYLSAAWKDKNIKMLRRYINRHFDHLMLFTLNVYLDYSLPDGGYNYGNDINPVLLKFAEDNAEEDEAIFIMVNVSDKS